MPDVRVDVEVKVGVITIDRPHALAIGLDTIRELDDAAESISTAGVSVLVVTGAEASDMRRCESRAATKRLSS